MTRLSLLGRTASILALYLVVTSNGAAQASGSLTGRVHDAETGRPVQGVMVTLTALPDSAVPLRITGDRDGRFTITGIAPGRYRIRIARIGYMRVEWEREVLAREDTLLVPLHASHELWFTCMPASADSVKRPAGKHHDFSAISLLVRDARTGDVISDGVTAVARGDASVDTLRAVDRNIDLVGFGAYVGGWVGARSAGTYMLSVLKPGYETRDRVPVEVRIGECGTPAVTMLEVFLQPRR